MGLLRLHDRAEDLAASAPLPWPRTGPWIGAQRWEHVLFMHWQIDVSVIRPLVPAELEIDTFDGSAWVSMLPLRMNDVHFRDLPPIPTLGDFPELNLRTYVTVGDKPGVYFWSLDAPSDLGVWLGKHLFDVNYRDAELRMDDAGTDISFTSRTTTPPSSFEAQWTPLGSSAPAAAGSVEYFLAERYCMYSVDGDGHIHRGDIAHQPWQLRKVAATVTANTVPESVGLPTLGEPHAMLCADVMENVVWRPVRVDPDTR